MIDSVELWLEYHPWFAMSGLVGTVLFTTAYLVKWVQKNPTPIIFAPEEDDDPIDEPQQMWYNPQNPPPPTQWR